MNTIYKNDNHEKRYKNIINTLNHTDLDTRAMLFIITGVDGLYHKINDIVSPNERIIYKEKIKSIDNRLSSSERRLLSLAIHLFDGDEEQDIVKLFNSLDIDNTALVLNAFKIRFKI